MDSGRPNFMGQEITGEKLNCRGCNYPQGEISQKPHHRKWMYHDSWSRNVSYIQSSAVIPPSPACAPLCVLPVGCFLLFFKWYTILMTSSHSASQETLTHTLLVTHHCFLCSCSLAAWRTCIFNVICKQCLGWYIARYMLFSWIVWD